MALRKNPINLSHLKLCIPYSLLMCTTNILTSFCITIMPLESFVSFKKFLILFVLLSSCFSAWLISRYSLNSNEQASSSQPEISKYKIISVLLIVLGGLMIGYYTRGTTIGYTSSMLSNVLEALSLQYCSYLAIYHGVTPSGLLLYNSILSLPYYLGIMVY